MAITLDGTAGITTPADTVSGNLTFTGTSNRITGDFSNATIASRVVLQSSTTNGATRLTLIPNGTSTASNIEIYNNPSDLSNSSFGQVRLNSSDFLIASSITGTGTYLPIVFTTGGSERARIDTSGYMTNTVNGNGAGLVQGQQYYRLNTAVAGANATGAQSIFGVGVTLVGSTVYEFEMVVPLSKTAGTTLHTVALGFGGTATINNIGYMVHTPNGNSSFNSAAAIAVLEAFISTASATVISGSYNNAGLYLIFLIKGTVSINAGGTFIPQYTLSAAPGGAYSTQIGSYIKISALSASGANTSIGTWA